MGNQVSLPSQTLKYLLKDKRKKYIKNKSYFPSKMKQLGVRRINGVRQREGKSLRIQNTIREHNKNNKKKSLLFLDFVLKLRKNEMKFPNKNYEA